VGNSPQFIEANGVVVRVPPGKKTRDVTAKGAGFASTDEARAVAFIVDHGSDSLLEAMDAETHKISVLAEVAKVPKPKQDEILASGPRGVREFIGNGCRPKKARKGSGKGAAPGEPCWEDCLRQIKAAVRQINDYGGITRFSAAWSRAVAARYHDDLMAVSAAIRDWTHAMERGRE